MNESTALIKLTKSEIESIMIALTFFKESSKFFDTFAIIEQEVFNSSLFLRRMDFNLQYYGQDGTTHVDGTEENEWTIMLMTNTKWKSEWGGQFQLLSDDRKTVIEEHEYIPGRVIIFPGNVPHRGLAPLDPYVYRYSTVFRTIIEDDLEDYFDQEYQNRKQCKV